MTIESLARRIENAADPDRFCTAVAACLERNGGDLEGAIELAETVQMDELFERFHPRGDGGKFRNKSERMKAKHARERETRRPERKPRDTGPKSSNRQAVEQAMEDPELRQHLVGIASKIGTDLRSQIDPEDVVQTAMARALKEADSLELTNIPGWLRKKTEESLRDATKGARAFKRGRGHKHMSLDEELDHAERIGQAQGHDPAMVIGQAMSKLAESDPKGAKLLSAYYGLKRMPKNRHTDAERKRAERARAKLIPMMKEIYGKLGEPPEPTASDREDVPGIPGEAYASGPKRKPAETRMPEDREWRKAGMTAAAHEGKVWHRKSPASLRAFERHYDEFGPGVGDAGPADERRDQDKAYFRSDKPSVHIQHHAVEELASDLNLSPEQAAAIHNIVKKPAQFDISPALQSPKPRRLAKVESVRRVPSAPFIDPSTLQPPITPYLRDRRDRLRGPGQPPRPVARLPSRRAWVTDAGVPIPVGYKTHWQVAEANGTTYDDAMKRGWVRVNPGGAQVGQLTPDALARVEHVLRHNPEMFGGSGEDSVSIESDSHPTFYVTQQDLEGGLDRLMPEAHGRSNYFSEEQFDYRPQPTRVMVGRRFAQFHAADTARVSGKPRQRMQSWQRPAVAGYNSPPTIAQEEPSWSPELAEHAKQSGVILGKLPTVTPSPEASVRDAVSVIGGLRSRFPRLGKVSPVILSVNADRERGGHTANPAKLVLGLGHHRMRLSSWKKRDAPLALPMRGERDAASVARHEYGHHLWWHLNDDEADAWSALHGEQMANAPEYATNVSDYATTHPMEGFAEAFAAMTHPDYGGENMPRLPAPIEAYLRRLLGRGG